jgi:hypothetical protein
MASFKIFLSNTAARLPAAQFKGIFVTAVIAANIGR